MSFSCNDYLGLSHHPRVKEAARQAVVEFGAGAGASRLVTGHHPLVQQLETRLADFKGADACLAFGSGYLTNLGVIPALMGTEDLILVDELAHACLFSGARLARSQVMVFRHNDWRDLEQRLQQHRSDHPRCMVLTEGVFSMDGDLAPLRELSRVCEAAEAWLLVDDAHATGTLAGGRGSRAFADDVAVPLQVGTLSKALGSYGGFLCASQPVVDLLKSRARTFVYSTGLPPPAAAAALAALEVIASEPERCGRPLALARRFCTRAGLEAPSSAIVPVMLGSAEQALSGMQRLEAKGILAVAIRPPTVAEGKARLRFAFCADHSEDDVDRAADALRELLVMSSSQRRSA